LAESYKEKLELNVFYLPENEFNKGYYRHSLKQQDEASL
jgi:hypothetical protein